MAKRSKKKLPKWMWWAGMVALTFYIFREKKPAAQPSVLPPSVSADEEFTV